MLPSHHDVLAVSGLDCAVARIASRWWHSYLKNGFLLLADGDLAQWLADKAAMVEFERCAREVCDGLRGYSASELVSLLPPLAALPTPERERMRERLDGAFDSGFRPVLVAREIEQALEDLLYAIRVAAAARGAEQEGDATQAVRVHAAALRSVLERLPAGFWMPRNIDGGSL